MTSTKDGASNGCLQVVGSANTNGDHNDRQAPCHSLDSTCEKRNNNNKRDRDDY